VRENSIISGFNCSVATALEEHMDLSTMATSTSAMANSTLRRQGSLALA
jgi:hypothetical protein